MEHIILLCCTYLVQDTTGCENLDVKGFGGKGVILAQRHGLVEKIDKKET